MVYTGGGVKLSFTCTSGDTIAAEMGYCTQCIMFISSMHILYFFNHK